MKSELERGRLAFSLAILLILCSTNIYRGIAFPLNANKNISSIDDYISESIGEEESLMESEVSRRFLVEDPNYLSYRGLQTQPVCNEKIYGNCLKAVAKDTRPCTEYNRCKRG